MTHLEIRKKFIDFFKERGHTVVPSSSLLPDDSSVLFTTAGMQQFKKYYTSEADPMKDFSSLNTVSIQKSMRTSDIDEVGDESHLTFFEMLGNFSFGGYWKKEAIEYAHEFITKEMGLEISYITVFKGSDMVPKDEESKKIWESLGVKDIREEGMEDVFWGPTGNSGPCGPTTEIYLKNKAGQDIEVWNIVFNEFFCDGSRDQLNKGEAKLKPLEKKGIDTGMGLERLAMISQNVENIFETDLFSFMLGTLPMRMNEREQRIVVDHARATTFMISDGIRPSNKEQGYVLRRLIRRMIVYLHQVSGESFNMFDMGLVMAKSIMGMVVKNYKEFYPELNQETFRMVWDDEEIKFKKTFRVGLKELEKLDRIQPQSAFKLYESYGLPFEIIKELGGDKTKSLTREDFDEEFKKHQEKSRAGAEKKFGGHGLILDTGELKAANEDELKIVTRLHTATHMLHAALRKVLGEEVHQAGSDITAERLRFDFTFPCKVTAEELKKVEDLVNENVKKDTAVTKQELPYEEALKTGALSFFKLKYPPRVNVYSVGDFSKELCGGPHVTHSGEIGHFKIIKEEASSAGVRRIRAIVE